MSLKHYSNFPWTWILSLTQKNSQMLCSPSKKTADKFMLFIKAFLVARSPVFEKVFESAVRDSEKKQEQGGPDELKIPAS